MWYDKTGQNIKIAIIDSGFKKCNGGISIFEDITSNEDYDVDSLQHGNIIADIISFYLNDAELYSVKIFHENLDCSISQLEKGSFASQNKFLIKIALRSKATTIVNYKL